MVGRIGGQGARERRQRFLRAIELAERRAPVGRRRREAGHQRRRPAERLGGALHVVLAQPQLAELEVRGRPAGRRGHRLAGQCRGVVEVVHLHARARHRQQPRRRAGLVEGPAAGREPCRRRGIPERRGQCAGRRRRDAGGRRRAAAVGRLHDRHLPPGPAPVRRFRRVGSEGVAIGGGDEGDVGTRGQRVLPELHHVERLGRDQPRAVGLHVLEGGVQLRHPDHGGGRPRIGRDEGMREGPLAGGRRFDQGTVTSRRHAAQRRRTEPAPRRMRRRRRRRAPVHRGPAATAGWQGGHR